MGVPDPEIIEALTSGTATVADHFLIEGAPPAVNPRGELMMLLIEDEDVVVAVEEYLRRIGAPEYASFEEYEKQRQRRTVTAADPPRE